MRAAHLACVVAILVLAGWLRFADLGCPAFHFDESTGARMVGALLDQGEYRFDPRHFHGPALAHAGAALASLHGESGWHELTAASLRAVSALSGLLVVFLALMAVPLVGRAASLFAAALLAVSPFLVHTSRLYIHEPLFALGLAGTGLAVAFWWQRPSFGLAAAVGVLVGLAAATRETFFIALFGWVVAAGLLRMPPPMGWRATLRQAGLAAGVAAGVAFVFYSEFLGRPSGAWDFISTYWSYATTPGHEKPAGYYAELFLWPEHYGRLFWWSGGVVILGALSFLLPGSKAASAARFLFVAALAQAAVYSLIPYKVPWLMVVPWIQFGFAAGFSAAGWVVLPRWRLLAIAATLALFIFDLRQSVTLVFRYPSDPRNPFAYVPTAPGVELWTTRCIEWLRASGVARENVAVVGPRYWPLPWYLRTLERVGYWNTLPPDAASMPLVIALPEAAEAATTALAKTHESVLEGLRTDTPVLVFFRNDVWEAQTRGGRE